MEDITYRRPRFSVLHTTARPNEWRECYDRWLLSADEPSLIEYVLCIDSRWGFTDPVTPLEGIRRPDGSLFKVVYNTGRKCMVDGYQTAAAHSTGEVLILNSDDMYPPAAWDVALNWTLRGKEMGEVRTSYLTDPLKEEFVIQTTSGTAADERGLMVLQILSRARYERLGYVMFPGYESMYADDDFSEHARLEGVVIDARHLHFLHIHPPVTEDRSGLDAVYRHQNREAAYELGARLLEVRRSIGFGNGISTVTRTAPSQPLISVCVPGDHFSGVWLGGFVNLFSQLICHGFAVNCHMNYSSNVYITRTCILESLKKAEGPKPDYVLWLDDDNRITYEQLEMLIHDLNQYPEAGIVAGWCYIQPDGYEIEPLTSCGYLGEGNSGEHITAQALQADGGLMQIDFTGFPAVLMRYQVIEDVSMTAFAPLPAPASRWGYTGEDVSFCINAGKAGHKTFVDSRVCVPHYKLRNAIPNMPGAEKAVQLS